MKLVRRHPEPAALTILLMVALCTGAGCAWFKQIGNPITMTPQQRLAQTNESYTATTEWLTEAAKAGQFSDSEKARIRAIRKQADSALNIADEVLKDGGDVSVTLEAIDKYLTKLLAEKSAAQRKKA